MSFVPPGQNLFIVNLTYTVPFDQIDPFIDAHVDFLEAHHATGIFLASGPKVPRSGGVIIATAESKETLAQMLTQDPFHKHGLADYAITEFRPTMTAPGSVLAGAQRLWSEGLQM